MDYSAYGSIDVEVGGDGVATLTLNRPDHMNSVDADMHDALERVWLDIARDRRIRAIILTGAGRAFSAGGDLKMIAARLGTEANHRRAMDIPAAALRIVAHMLEVQQPIICAINGDAVGLGATLALACDITVMSDSARLGDTHVRAGLVAGDGGTVLWPMLLGPARAKDLLMRGRLVKAPEALSLNLVNYVVPAERVLAEATAIASELSALAPRAVQWTKASINRMMKRQLSDIFDAAIAFESLTMLSDDHAEAIRAMVDKRRPDFSGY